MHCLRSQNHSFSESPRVCAPGLPSEKRATGFSGMENEETYMIEKCFALFFSPDMICSQTEAIQKEKE